MTEPAGEAGSGRALPAEKEAAQPAERMAYEKMPPPAEKIGKQLAERLAPERRVWRAETKGVWPAATQDAQRLDEVLGLRFPRLVAFCAGLADRRPPELSPHLSH